MDEVALRPESPGDEAFLLELYGSTRSTELAHVPWTQEQKQRFLADQFRLQSIHYRSHYPGAEFHIVTQAGRAIGRLYLCCTREEIRLMDIALIPECRGRGIGSRLLQTVLDAGAAAAKPVVAHVERNNPALSLYQRRGFSVMQDDGVYLRLECSARPAEAADKEQPSAQQQAE